MVAALDSWAIDVVARGGSEPTAWKVEDFVLKPNTEQVECFRQADWGGGRRG